jgi:hypothetical protein
LFSSHLGLLILDKALIYVAVPNSVDKYDVKTEMEKSKQKKKYAIEHRGTTEEQVTLEKRPPRDETKSEIHDYIGGFYNSVLCHKHLDQLSPHEFERQRKTEE